MKDLLNQLEAKTLELEAAPANKKAAIQAEIDLIQDQIDILESQNQATPEEATPEVATPRDPNEITIRVSKARETQSGKAYIVNNKYLIPVRNALQYFIGSSIALEGKTLNLTKGPVSTGTVPQGQEPLQLATISAVSGMEIIAAKESEAVMHLMLDMKMKKLYPSE